MMGLNPFVGVTSDWKSEGKNKYVRVDKVILKWLSRENITPIVFPSLPGKEDSMLESVSAVVIPGGKDILPKFYGGIIDENCEEFCDVERTSFESALLWRCARLNIPVLGICLGCQAINVAFGGTLIFHLEDPFSHHRNKDSKAPVFHRIYPKGECFIKKLAFTKHTRVSSSHHQAVGRLAPSFYASAYGPDKVIEVIESNDFPLIKGIQWHPERTPRSPLSKSLARWLREKAIEKSGK
jgi:putative glutamine amidotransferase